VVDTLITKRPAVRFVILFALGIVLAASLTVSSSVLLFLLVPLFVLSVTGALRKSRAIVYDVSLQVLVVMLGAYLQSVQRESAASRRLNPVAEEPMWIEARIDGEPVRQEKKITFVLRTGIIRRDATEDRTSRRILTTLRGISRSPEYPSLRCGARIVARATLEPFPFQRNPGEFDYGRYLTLNDIQGVATIADPEDCMATEESSFSSFNAFVGMLQRTLYHRIDEYHSHEQASFLKGVILGYRADLSPEIKQSFVNTGTIHILAVSGSNVAVIVLIIYSLMGFFRLPKRISGIFTIAGILIFMFITGASPSVVRASIMACVLMVGTMVERKTDIYNSLAIAAMIILLIDTRSLFDVGFQLSFAAVVSIVYFYPILVKVINRIPERFEEIKAVDYLLKLLAVSLAAQIGTLPFTAYYFGRISLVSLLANLIVVPLSGINVLLGVATVAFSCVSTFVASCYAALNGLAIDFLLGFVRAAGDVPYAYTETARFTSYHALFYYSMVAILFHLNNPRIVKWGIVAGLIVLNGTVVRAIAHSGKGVVRVTFLDVGQGDAILVQSPMGRTMLVDAGPREFRYDAGERTIAPFLKRTGISELDVVALSHSHSDHIGGVPFLLESGMVSQIVECDVGASSALYRKLKEIVNQRQTRYRSTERGDVIPLDSTMRLYVLHPRVEEDAHRSLNNTSVVLKLMYGKTSMLLSGDAEVEAEDRFCPRYRGFLASDILKVGHHGSATSTSESLLDCVRPAVAVVSVGTRNKFGHPSPATIARLVRHRMHVWRTDRQGAAVFESDGQVWTQRDWRSDGE
jgi:competence protein ComEC